MDDNQVLKSEIFSTVNVMFDANYKRMTDWEKGAVANIQNNVANLMREVSPKQATLFQHYFDMTLQASLLGAAIGITMHFLK